MRDILRPPIRIDYKRSGLFGLLGLTVIGLTNLLEACGPFNNTPQELKTIQKYLQSQRINYNNFTPLLLTNDSVNPQNPFDNKVKFAGATFTDSSSLNAAVLGENGEVSVMRARYIVVRDDAKKATNIYLAVPQNKDQRTLRIGSGDIKDWIPMFEIVFKEPTGIKELQQMGMQELAEKVVSLHVSFPDGSGGMIIEKPLAGAKGSEYEAWMARIAELLGNFNQFGPKEAMAAGEETPTKTVMPVLTKTPTTPLPSPTPSPAPTEAPTVTPTRAAEAINQIAGGQFEVITKTGERLTVPSVPGLRQEIKVVSGVKQVVFTAEKGNLYGLKEGAYAGFFYSYVNTQEKGQKEKLTGGVALKASVVRELIAETLKKEKYVFPIPVDISILSSNPTNSISVVEATATSKKLGVNYAVIINVPSGLPVINLLGFDGKDLALDENLKVSVMSSTVVDASLYDLERRVEPYTDKVYPGREMRHVITRLSPSRQIPNQGYILDNIRFGDKIIIDGQALIITDRPLSSSILSFSPNGNMAITVEAATERQDVRLRHILTVTNSLGASSPVFILAND